jgi:hypothetical protein
MMVVQLALFWQHFLYFYVCDTKTYLNKRDAKIIYDNSFFLQGHLSLFCKIPRFNAGTYA